MTISMSSANPSLLMMWRDSFATLGWTSIPTHLHPNILLNMINVTGSGPLPINTSLVFSLNGTSSDSLLKRPSYLS